MGLWVKERLTSFMWRSIRNTKKVDSPFPTQIQVPFYSNHGHATAEDGRNQAHHTHQPHPYMKPIPQGTPQSPWGVSPPPPSTNPPPLLLQGQVSSSPSTVPIPAFPSIIRSHDHTTQLPNKGSLQVSGFQCPRISLWGLNGYHNEIRGWPVK